MMPQIIWLVEKWGKWSAS